MTNKEWLLQAQSALAIPNAEYDRLAAAFNPICFNAEDYIKLAKRNVA